MGASVAAPTHARPSIVPSGWGRLGKGPPTGSRSIVRSERGLHVTPRSNLPSQGCGEDGRPAPFRRSISQHVGLSSHHYQQLLLLYEIGSSIDRGQAKFALVALGHARHGYIYIYAVRAGLPAAAFACVRPAWLRRAACFAWRGMAQMCRVACSCSGSLQRSALAQVQSASGDSLQVLCVLRCARLRREWRYGL